MSDPGIVTDAAAPAPAAAAAAAPTSPAPADEAPAQRSFLRRYLWPLVVAVVVLDVLAFILVPPYPKELGPGHPVTGISDLINANLEFPAPNVVLDFAPDPNTYLARWPFPFVIGVSGRSCHSHAPSGAQ